METLRGDLLLSVLALLLLTRRRVGRINLEDGLLEVSEDFSKDRFQPSTGTCFEM